MKLNSNWLKKISELNTNLKKKKDIDIAMVYIIMC